MIGFKPLYNMKKYFKLFLLTVLAFSLGACRSVKNDIYLSNTQEGVAYPYEYHEPVVHLDDRLTITVSSRSPELAIPFNSNGGVYAVNNNGLIDETSTQTRKTSYRVDKDGDINFPILGKLHVVGLTANGVQDLVRSKIIEGKYIKDPLVTMEFDNFKYTVLGEVGHTGTFTVSNGRITLLEAIANAGDLTANANNRRVLVYREENGIRKMYVHDIRNNDIFYSPCYNLQQNDLVYVEPRKHKSSGNNPAMGIVSLVVSIISAIATIMWATK